MIVDIILILIVLLFICIGAFRGFARTLLNLIGTVLNLVLSRFLSALLANWVYTAFIQPTVLSNLETSIVNNGFSEAVANSLKSVPEWLDTLLATVFAPLGLTLEDLQKGVFIGDNQARQLAQVIEEPLGKLIIAVLSICLMLLLFFVFLVIIKLIIRAVLKLFDLPGISGINRFFGAVLGALEGIVLICIAINIFYVIMTSTDPNYFSDPMWSGTLFRALCIYIR